MKFILSVLSTVIATCFLAIVGFLVLGAILQCEHEEMGTIFAFQFQNSTASSSTQPFCKECHQRFRATRFRGTPDDLSYLEVIREHSDGNEIVGGEYYTITAIVTLADYDFQKTTLKCKVESEDIVVAFSVEFKDGFEDAVALLDEGDEITFRGRLYDEGCGWTDCELLNN